MILLNKQNLIGICSINIGEGGSTQTIRAALVFRHERVFPGKKKLPAALKEAGSSIGDERR
jgi:hypothetical protein